MLRRQLLMVASVALLLVGCEIGNPGPNDRVAYPAAPMTKTLDDVPYGTEDQQVLDIYAPAARNGGAILWIHGGGWADANGAANTLATEEQVGMQPVVRALYRRGWTVFSVRYSGTDEAVFPKPLQDVKQAVRWVKAHASDYGVSPSSIVAMGFSAGGHLAGLLGVTAGQMEPSVPASLANQTSRVAAVVSIAGVLDPATFPFRYGLPPGNASGVAALLGCPAAPARWATCNPALLQTTRLTTFDDPSDSPIYIVQGARDGIVDPVTQGRTPYDALVKTMGDDRVWLDMVDTGSSLSYSGLDPQNHSMALSYELNMTALADFASRVLPARVPARR
jgi:acetyl esterase/lipase